MDSNFSSTEAQTVPRELAGPLPRKLRLSGNGRQTAAVAALLLAFAVAGGIVWVGMGALQQMLHRTALRRGASEATGEIEKL